MPSGPPTATGADAIPGGPVAARTPTTALAGRHPLPARAGTFTLEEFADHFERPWLEICFFHFDAPAQYQVQYGREAGRAVGIASLLLCLDFAPEQKERLLTNLVQYGIDLWGIVRAGYGGWPAHGGHGPAEVAIVFAGLMLGDEEMQSPTVTYRTSGSARTCRRCMPKAGPARV